MRPFHSNEPAVPESSPKHDATPADSKAHPTHPHPWLFWVAAKRYGIYVLACLYSALIGYTTPFLGWRRENPGTFVDTTLT